VLRLAGALATLLVLVSASSAIASNFGSNTASYNTPAHPCDTDAWSQCIANNGLHTYYLGNVEPNQAAATRATCTQDYDPVLDVACSERTSSTNADVWVNDAAYMNGAWAWTACTAALRRSGLVHVSERRHGR